MNYLDYANSFVWTNNLTNILCISCNITKNIKRQTLLKLARNHYNKHKTMANYSYRCKNCKPSGSNCSKWKGGRVLRRGYLSIHKSCVPEKYRAMCCNNDYIPEHRLVVAMRENRCLLSTEHVHHIDFNILNNNSNNLLLIDPSSHCVITKLSKIISDQKIRIELLESEINSLKKTNNAV